MSEINDPQYLVSIRCFKVWRSEKLQIYCENEFEGLRLLNTIGYSKEKLFNNLDLAGILKISKNVFKGNELEVYFISIRSILAFLDAERKCLYHSKCIKLANSKKILNRLSLFYIRNHVKYMPFIDKKRKTLNTF